MKRHYEFELVQAISDDLEAELRDNFLGRPLTPALAETIKAFLMIKFKSYYIQTRISLIPKVEVVLNGSALEVSLYDPFTNEPISGLNWLGPKRNP